MCVFKGLGKKGDPREISWSALYTTQNKGEKYILPQKNPPSYKEFKKAIQEFDKTVRVRVAVAKLNLTRGLGAFCAGHILKSLSFGQLCHHSLTI